MFKWGTAPGLSSNWIWVRDKALVPLLVKGVNFNRGHNVFQKKMEKNKNGIFIWIRSFFREPNDFELPIFHRYVHIIWDNQCVYGYVERNDWLCLINESYEQLSKYNIWRVKHWELSIYSCKFNICWHNNMWFSYWQLRSCCLSTVDYNFWSSRPKLIVVHYFPYYSLLKYQ